MESIYTISQRRIQHVKTDFYRYLYDKIEWDDRLIAIKGARGTGKTTMMLQYMKQKFGTDRRAVYASLDDMFFSRHPIQEFVEYHYTHGGVSICLDEVHKHPDWQTVIKNLYDSYPDLQIIYSGSSMLQLDSKQGDLSRRQAVYELSGLSFREFLEFEGLYKAEPVSLEQLLSDHERLSSEVVANLKIIPAFQKYLQMGYYPFYKEVKGNLQQRLSEMARQIIEVDMPAIEDIKYSTIEKTKRMLMVLASNVPQTPKMTDLYRELETDREQGLKMLQSLCRSGLLQLLRYDSQKLKKLSKPDKILIDNPNMYYTLSSSADTGSVRESFFCSQLRVVSDLLLSRKGDFIVDDKYIFEVGGKNKTFDQIANLPDSYLAVDDIEYGIGKRIPLWLFGFLY